MWDIPDDPRDQAEALEDCHGTVWLPHEHGWISADGSTVLPWRRVFILGAPLHTTHRPAEVTR